ncbi:MAG: alpha-xylosidase, partial [Defluviitaleaceae bacterium]|nr:alpha-xylosidase [Defluviitaleaceae bacterium]
MKFTDGYWKVREGTTIHYAGTVGDVEIDSCGITVYSFGQPAKSGKAIGGTNLTYRFTSPSPDVIRVRMCHHKGDVNVPKNFLNPDDIPVKVEETEDCYIMVSGKTKVEISRKDGWDIRYYYDGRYLTGSSWRSSAYITCSNGERYTKEELSLSVGEQVYGLGERFGPFIKNGQEVEIWNRDGGTSSEQSYKNIPFYLTNRGYGVLVNDSGRVCFEVASEKVTRVQFSLAGEFLDYLIIGGADLREVMGNYTSLAGKPALPPAWSFGLWLTTSFTTNYDEETVTSFTSGMAERDIPLHIFHFDCFWMKGEHWCNFEWDPVTFPDPQGMLYRMKQQGLKICVWINPYIGQRSRLFEEGMKNGYFIRKTDGSVWQGDEWQPGMGIVDFTNPAACKWYADELHRLMDMGVDTFKTDFGERIPHEDVVYFDGSHPEKMHNYYPQLFNKVVFEVLEKKKGVGKALVFARSATCGGQQFPVHWGGDCFASFESMAESLRGGLSLSMCGFGYWSHDMGGFESNSSPDLYKRWIAFGMFSSHSRLHGNNSYRVPWLYDEESVDVLRHFTKLKCCLMPYYYKTAVQVRDSGVPFMRPMILDFMNDPVAGWLDRQYMLGDSLLVAPVFAEDGQVQYYLPEGNWTHLLTNETSTGGWRNDV